PLLAGLRVAVARYEAFSFVYQTILDQLVAMAARLNYFSPLRDHRLPDADSLYLPGGYPELHLDSLADNGTLLAAIRRHHRAGKPIVAECGGMLYLLESLARADGHLRALAGLFPAAVAMVVRW